MEAAMGRIWLLAMAFFGFVTVAVAAEEERAKQPSAPAVPPASGSSSSELSRSGGVITPPIGVDPQMKQTPPPSGDGMPVVPPPGTPGGNPAVCISSASMRLVDGTFSEGFSTKVFPHTIAMGNIQSGTIAGKLNGVIPTQTPSG